MSDFSDISKQKPEESEIVPKKAQSEIRSLYKGIDNEYKRREKKRRKQQEAPQSSPTPYIKVP
jgi:hypothetical protein